MAERFAVGILPGIGWRAYEIEVIAREAEGAGFEAILTVEVKNDGLATTQLMGSVTNRIKVGTWVANIYLRHSYLCAQAASFFVGISGSQSRAVLRCRDRSARRPLLVLSPAVRAR